MIKNCRLDIVYFRAAWFATIVAVSIAMLFTGIAFGCDERQDKPDAVAQQKESANKASSTAVDEPKFNEIHQRALRTFDKATLYKPKEGLAEGLAWTLAPLVVQEQSTNERDWVNLFRLGLCPDSPEVEGPIGHTPMRLIEITGRPYRQIIYAWNYRGIQYDDFDPRLRGIRITISPSDFPIVWEVFTHGQPYILYVAESLERAAAQKFGSPLPGRRYSVERALTEAPHVIVARVIEDGPQPMGPYLYVDAAKLEITTVLCRCMPAQVNDIPESRYYSLHPDDQETEAWLKGGFSREPLDRILRWPTHPPP